MSAENINSVGKNVAINNGSVWNTLIFFILLIGFLLWNVYQQNKREKKKQEMLTQLKEGDLIETFGGIVGIIGFISDDKKIVELKTGINFNSKLSINIQAIDRKLDNQTPTTE